MSRSHMCYAVVLTPLVSLKSIFALPAHSPPGQQARSIVYVDTNTTDCRQTVSDPFQANYDDFIKMLMGMLPSLPRSNLPDEILKGRDAYYNRHGWQKKFETSEQKRILSLIRPHWGDGFGNTAFKTAKTHVLRVSNEKKADGILREDQKLIEAIAKECMPRRGRGGVLKKLPTKRERQAIREATCSNLDAV